MKISQTNRWPQYLATFAATMGSFGLGTGIGWSSPTLPLLLDDCHDNGIANCAFKAGDGIEPNQAKWVSGIFNLGAMVASAMTGILLTKVGRKWAMIINCVPMALGYFCLMLPLWLDPGFKVALFLVGRFLTGVGCGGFALVPPLFVGEVSETAIRGSLGTCMHLMLIFGKAFVSSFGIRHAVSVDVISGLCIVPPLACAAMLSFIPETPYFLITRGKVSEAQSALHWFKNGKELIDIQRAYEDQRKIGSITFVKLITDLVYLQPFLLMTALMFFQMFSGINAVNFNLVSIFHDAGSQMDEGLPGFIINATQASTYRIIYISKYV